MSRSSSSVPAASCCWNSRRDSPNAPDPPPRLPPIPGPVATAIEGKIVTLPAVDGSLRYRVLLRPGPGGTTFVTAASLRPVEQAVQQPHAGARGRRAPGAGRGVAGELVGDPARAAPGRPHGRDRGRDRRRGPQPPRARRRSGDGAGPAGNRAQRDAGADRGRHPGASRGGGEAPPLRRRRRPRAAHAPDLPARLRRALSPGSAADHGGGRQRHGSYRVGRRAHGAAGGRSPPAGSHRPGATAGEGAG